MHIFFKQLTALSFISPEEKHLKLMLIKKKKLRTLKEDISSGNCLWKKKIAKMFTDSQDPFLNHSLFPLSCWLFSPHSSFVGGIMHSAARKLECECHVSVHFDQMWALFGCETQTADSSYAGKMSREPPSNTQHWALLCLRSVWGRNGFSLNACSFDTHGEYVHLDRGESTIPLAISLMSLFLPRKAG